MSKILVHICCSIDSHYFLKRLRTLHVEDEIIGYFYNPNVHPKSEHDLRLLDVARSCDNLGIELIKGDYELDRWLLHVKGYESEPERGARCELCFDMRLLSTLHVAQKIKADHITTTLLMSPQKSHAQLQKSAQSITCSNGVGFLAYDFRTKGGTSEQFALAKKDKLYHQNYCGCIYALLAQRKKQNKKPYELMSQIGANKSAQNLTSNEEKMKLYQTAKKLDEEKKNYMVLRENIMDYRLFGASIKDAEKNVLDSFFLYGSHSEQKSIKTKALHVENGVWYLNKNGAIIISLKKLNKLMKTAYINVSELIKSPLHVEAQIKLRQKITSSNTENFNIIIVLDSPKLSRYEIHVWSEIFANTREKIINIQK